MPPQKDSTTGLSYGSPTVPSEGESPALRARSVKDQEVQTRLFGATLKPLIGD